jgi:lipopolysaccharide export system protein LptC
MGPLPTDTPDPGDAPRPPAKLLKRRRTVALLRIMLPLAALLLATLVIVWPKFQGQDRASFKLGSAGTDPKEVEQLTMMKPRFVGLDSKQQPYTVTALSATQDKPGADLIMLDHPQADITLEGGAWATATANSGAYAQKDQILDLAGDINVFHDSGYEFHTEQAELDLANDTMDGTVPVTGHGPGGTIEAAHGFTVLDHGRTVLFHGPAKLTINPGVKGVTAAPAPPGSPSKSRQEGRKR